MRLKIEGRERKLGEGRLDGKWHMICCFIISSDPSPDPD